MQSIHRLNSTLKRHYSRPIIERDVRRARRRRPIVARLHIYPGSITDASTTLRQGGSIDRDRMGGSRADDEHVLYQLLILCHTEAQLMPLHSSKSLRKEATGASMIDHATLTSSLRTA